MCCVHRPDMITVEQLEAALGALKAVGGEAKVKSLIAVLDEDHDGNINLDDIAEVRHTHTHTHTADSV